jgi:CDP-diglyceride synthetase
MIVVYVIGTFMAAYIIGKSIGMVKKHSEKYEVVDFLIGYSIVIICSLIYLLIN